MMDRPRSWATTGGGHAPRQAGSSEAALDLARRLGLVAGRAGWRDAVGCGHVGRRGVVGGGGRPVLAGLGVLLAGLALALGDLLLVRWVEVLFCHVPRA